MYGRTDDVSNRTLRNTGGGLEASKKAKTKNRSKKEALAKCPCPRHSPMQQGSNGEHAHPSNAPTLPFKKKPPKMPPPPPPWNIKGEKIAGFVSGSRDTEKETRNCKEKKEGGGNRRGFFARMQFACLFSVYVQHCMQAK